jgi:alkane 1-monooxygenase
MNKQYQISKFSRALPFWASLGLLPLAWISAIWGGWTLVLMPLASWALFSVLDKVTGLDTTNPETDTPDDALFWYRLITLVWAPLQFLTVFGAIGYMSRSGHLDLWEMFAVAFGLGIISGTIGIVYAHELMHQKDRFERRLADSLLAMALYGHFRSEHLLVHHRYVGTPRDTVTARYNENFHAYFPRVLVQSVRSSWNAERAMLDRKGLPFWDRSNPFWFYAALQSGFLLVALIAGGWIGLGLFAFQALVAVWQLELTNYVEHYGLTRKHLGNGSYEHTKPHHSWNAAHRASNWLLINLQRHPDHHARPDRRFPLLQTYSEHEAPQLPHGYPIMTLMALIPPLWRRRMNPRVRRWRQMFYPEITDWTPYTTASNPMPR